MASIWKPSILSLMPPDLANLEECIAWLMDALERRYEADWLLWDRCAVLASRYQKPEVKAIAEGLGRSHQCVYRWAEYSRAVPEDRRRPDVSPLYQATQALKARLGASEGQE